MANTHIDVTITTMNDSNRWHITENLPTTEERGKEKRDGDRGGGDLYTKDPHRDFYLGGTERMLS